MEIKIKQRAKINKKKTSINAPNTSYVGYMYMSSVYYNIIMQLVPNTKRTALLSAPKGNKLK